MKKRTSEDKAVIARFGRRLTALRTARDGVYMTQVSAAERAGLGRDYWRRLEHGLSDPSLTSLLRIQHALGVDSIETLLGPTASAGLAEALGEDAGGG